MDFLTSLVNSMPGAVAQGLIWGIMAIGVYITYRILDVADLTVDGSLGTGGAVCVVLVLNGVPVGVALVAATLVGMLAGLVAIAAIICLREIFDEKLHSEDDITQRYQLPILAVIPDLAYSGAGAYRSDYEPAKKEKTT
mgnify:CR=1 FL=1